MKSDQSWRSSAESFKALIMSGSLNRKLTEVVRQMSRDTPLWQSRSEIARGTESQRENDVSTRLRELARRGVVRIHDERSECPITGCTVNKYALTNARKAGPRPKKPKKKTKTKIVTQTCTNADGSSSCPFYWPDEDTESPGCWAAQHLKQKIVYEKDFDYNQRPERCPLSKRIFTISDN